MSIGLIGRKIGMTRVFDGTGNSVPVTVVCVESNRVTQKKDRETDGYRAVQVTAGTCKPSRLTKPMQGHYAKANVEAGHGLWEFRYQGDSAPEVGTDLSVTQFSEGQYVDVTGTTKGKGFAGTIKRHHFRGQDNTHGNSLAHRAPGSIGQCQTPGRVFRGKKMSGQMGSVRKTGQNLLVMRVDSERNLLLIKGAVPGSRGGDLIIRPATKMPRRVEQPPSQG